jgi:hypothetical protein
MEILKSSLKQVPEAERVKGRVYGISDVMEGELTTTAIFNYGNKSSTNMHWLYWFELPESMLPMVMPEVGKEYEMSGFGMATCVKKLRSFKSADGFEFDHIRPISLNPAQSLSIPAGTKAEQLEFLRGVIATFEGGGV